MEFLRALAALAEPPRPAQARVAAALGLAPPDAAAHTDLFVLQLPPYASVYLGDDGMLGGGARDRVAGFLRALGLVPPPDPDHLTLLVGLAADLAEQTGGTDPADRARVHHARRALLWEHLLPWLPLYLDAVARVGRAPYDAWAGLLDRALRAEAVLLGPPPDALPLHLRAAPSLPDPRAEGGDAFLSGLLAPVRAGFVLTRADLQWLARDRGLGLRIGERRFVLRALMGQDAPAVLGGLAAVAGDVAGRWAQLGWLGATGAFWRARASAAASLLAELADEAARPGQASSAPGVSPGRQKSSISTT